MTTSATPDQPALQLTGFEAGQFGYHVRMAAVFAVAGEAEAGAAESILAWTLLAMQWPDAATSTSNVGAELVDQQVAALSDEHRAAALVRARGLALDLEAHYVSVGRHGEATLYADVAERLEGTIAGLVPGSH